MIQMLQSLGLGGDGIYTSPYFGKKQTEEIALRREVALRSSENLLEEVATHHSVEVMDQEVARFVSSIAHGGTIIDVGGCWGWHWRHIAKTRPDLNIVIMDIVRENLSKARQFLGPLIDQNIFLVHGDATHTPFGDQTFDGYWSVQTLQHIEDFPTAINEAVRILKAGGRFSNYILNRQWPIEQLYRLLGKDYHIKGSVNGCFYLERGSKQQAKAVEAIFKSAVSIRYSEVLFKPELNCHRPGRPNALLGKLDAQLSGSLPLLKLLARQISYHTQKPFLSKL